MKKRKMFFSSFVFFHHCEQSMELFQFEVFVNKKSNWNQMQKYVDILSKTKFTS